MTPQQHSPENHQVTTCALVGAVKGTIFIFSIYSISSSVACTDYFPLNYTCQACIPAHTHTHPHTRTHARKYIALPLSQKNLIIPEPK